MMYRKATMRMSAPIFLGTLLAVVLHGSLEANESPPQVAGIKFGPFTLSVSMDEAVKLSGREPRCRKKYVSSEDNLSITLDCAVVHFDDAALTVLKFTPTGSLISIMRRLAVPPDLNRDEALQQGREAYSQLGVPLPIHESEGPSYYTRGCHPDAGKNLIGFCWGDQSWYVGVKINTADLPDGLVTPEELATFAKSFTEGTVGGWLLCSWENLALEDLTWNRIEREKQRLQEERRIAREQIPKPKLKF